VATVTHFIAGWSAAGPAQYLLPGDEHEWTCFGFIAGEDAVSITASPYGSLPPGTSSEWHWLAVRNIAAGFQGTESAIRFAVKNVGRTPIMGYVFGIGDIAA
jgi:hypothetical protein